MNSTNMATQSTNNLIGTYRYYDYFLPSQTAMSRGLIMFVFYAVFILPSPHVTDGQTSGILIFRIFLN